MGESDVNIPPDRDKGAEPDPQDESTDEHLLGRMARFRKNPFDWFHEISLFISGTDWRGYDNILGQPIFYPGYTNKMKTAVLSSPILLQKLADLTEARLRVEREGNLLNTDPKSIDQETERRREEIQNSLVQITGQMVDKMICKMESKAGIRTAFYVATQMLTRAYSGVHVSKEQVARLRAVAAIAAEKKQSIIFLPRHTSHIDYISLHLICYRLGLTLPVVVAGDNLNFPLVGPFLQSMGAMWIRRSFDNDQLYTTLVQAYLDTMLQNGFNLECFIEGGRSRTGKLLGPKFGILRFFLDSVLSGRTEDVYICPVSMQYDKVVEVDSYVTELLGKPKQKENLTDFIYSSKVLSLSLGTIDCRFHEPWSLKEFIREQQARQDTLPEPSSLDYTISAEARIRLLRTLGYKVLSDINEVSVVMPTALVGTVLLTLRGRGVGMSELVRRVDWLCARIRANGGAVADFHNMPTKYVVERALEVLGPQLVGTVEALAEETYYAVDRFQLSFYRNMTIHLFISESLIAAALYTKVKQGGGSADQRIKESELTDKVSFLSLLFRGEFIFPAGQGLDRNLEKALSGLIADEVLEMSEGPDGSREIGLTNSERQKGRENFDFYCFLLWPFCDAAWLGAVSLLCLVPPVGCSDVWIGMDRAQATAQLMGRTIYHQGDLSYFEAINKEALKNAYSRFQEEGIILVSKSRDTKAEPKVRLAPDWVPQRNNETGALIPAGRLWDFTERIAQHRREGKNRRDGATVSIRVLSLAVRLGEQLFEKSDSILGSLDSAPLKPTERRSRL